MSSKLRCSTIWCCVSTRFPCELQESSCKKHVSTVDVGLFSPVPLQCPVPTYLCSAQTQNIPAVPVPNPKVSWNPGNARPLQCPTQSWPCCEVALYPGSAQPLVSLQCRTPKYPCSAQTQSISPHVSGSSQKRNNLSEELGEGRGGRQECGGDGGMHVTYSLNSLNGVIYGVIYGIGVIKGDTRSLDYSSCGEQRRMEGQWQVRPDQSDTNPIRDHLHYRHFS